MFSSSLSPVSGTHVGTSVLVFRASTWFEFGWTILYILPAALMAFMLGVSEYLLVYHTSGLTLSISGVFKVCVCLHLAVCACTDKFCLYASNDFRAPKCTVLPKILL